MCSTIRPEELYARQQRGENIILLDSRTPEEHRRATIPGSRSAPGGELALRISELVPDPDTEVVVHCAGRTRSIIGARLLQRMGFRKVYDLRNGTMGWGMAGLELEHGSQRLELPDPSPCRSGCRRDICGACRSGGRRALTDYSRPAGVDGQGRA